MTQYIHRDYLLKVVLLATAYFGLARIGFLFSLVESNVTLIWPSTGLAIAVLFLYGFRLWPGVAIGAFCVVASTGAPWGFNLASTIGNTLEALAGAAMLQRVGFDPALARVRHVAYLIGAACLSATISASIGVAGLCASGMVPWAIYGSLWGPWWVGNSMGTILIAPLIFIWTAYPNPIRSWPFLHSFEAVLLVLANIVVSVMVFSDIFTSRQTHLALMYLPFLTLLWAGLRFGPFGAASMNLVVNSIAVIGTASGHGPFANQTINESLLLLWAFMSSASIAVLFTATLATTQYNARMALSYAEQALRQSEARYRSLIEDTPVLLCRFQPGGVHEFVNTSYARTFGLKPEDLIGRSFMEFVPEDQRTNVIARIESLSLESPVNTQDNIVVHPSGEANWYRWTNRLLIDETGKKVYQSVGENITERKRAEEALRRSEARFRAIVENSNDGIIFIDANGIINYRSPSFKHINGFNNEERLGRSLFEIVHPDDVEMMTHTWNQILLHPEIIHKAEYRIRHQNGTWIWIETIAQNLLDNPNVQAVIFASHDITEHKRAEEVRNRLEAQLLQAQKMEAIGRLAGGIAHDFNNILVPIIGYSDLILMNLAPGDESYADLQYIRKSAERAAELTRQILAFSRKQVLEMRTVDLNALINDFQSMIQRLIGEHIELQTVLNPALDRVKADSGQLEQVLLNLAVNARDAMLHGGKLTFETDNVYLDATYIEQYGDALIPGHYIMLAVRDTGHGIDTTIQPHIFEPFFTTKEPGKGTGLGLATVFGIIKQHGGSIWLYSEPGKGSTFKIYLPRTEAPLALLEPDPIQHASPDGTETILVVEDEIIVRKLVCETLVAHGYTVIESLSSSDSLKRVAEHTETIDMLLTDVIMPEMNGYELYQHIVLLHKDIKVLYMSGYTYEVIAHHGILDEGINFLQKPFTIHDLIHKVRRILG